MKIVNNSSKYAEKYGHFRYERRRTTALIIFFLDNNITKLKNVYRVNLE